ncbi:MAG: hypothetical protein F6K50_52640 [Moorea sp. SIO3I7]|uniref:hypothetical protein n=1 Tax=Moorena TaxID=1155738 RepID=UPI0013019BB9|nr:MULTISPECIES: hypothetical protein [Moorena]NEO03639.1 hypothetical protein [Moorena sp. SIO3I7]NEO11837.1 hypothetical protein [Moorena sp. SIO3E8]NEO62323.1 hypothetical protein [Moorena sp. SIO4G2]NEP98756.1 hypothetical protein [Moorena sp. SIO3F7]
MFSALFLNALQQQAVWRPHIGLLASSVKYLTTNHTVDKFSVKCLHQTANIPEAMPS